MGRDYSYTNGATLRDCSSAEAAGVCPRKGERPAPGEKCLCTVRCSLLNYLPKRRSTFPGKKKKDVNNEKEMGLKSFLKVGKQPGSADMRARNLSLDTFAFYSLKLPRTRLRAHLTTPAPHCPWPRPRIRDVFVLRPPEDTAFPGEPSPSARSELGLPGPASPRSPRPRRPSRAQPGARHYRGP